MIQELKVRNFGLDLVRALAIIFVMLAHSGIRPFFGIDLGVIGVELFFVLSGFLVGKALLKSNLANASTKVIFRFYIYRWVRTLPLYFLVLLIKDIADSDTFHWKFYLFLQSPHDFMFFPVSWSLVIEEWFYLLLPVFLLFNIKILKIPFTIYILMLIFLVVILRGIIIYKNQLVFDLDIRKNWLFRFDALFIGVALSYFKLKHPNRHLNSGSNYTVLYSLLTFCIGIYFYKHSVLQEKTIGEPLTKGFMQTFTLVFLSVALALFIMWIENNNFINNIKNKCVINVFTFFSFVSYPIYLIHFDFFLKIPYVKGVTFEWLSLTVFYWILVIILAALLHFFIEKPITESRDRLSKKFLKRIRLTKT